MEIYSSFHCAHLPLGSTIFNLLVIFALERHCEIDNDHKTLKSEATVELIDLYQGKFVS